MEVEYTITVEDLQTFLTYQRGGKLAFQPKARRSEWIWFVLLGVMVGAFILFPSQLGRVIDTIVRFADPIFPGLIGASIGFLFAFFL